MSELNRDHYKIFMRDWILWNALSKISKDDSCGALVCIYYVGKWDCLWDTFEVSVLRCQNCRNLLANRYFMRRSTPAIEHRFSFKYGSSSSTVEVTSDVKEAHRTCRAPRPRSPLESFSSPHAVLSDGYQPLLFLLGGHWMIFGLSSCTHLWFWQSVA